MNQLETNFSVRYNIPNLKAAKIINKENLYKYLKKDFSKLFFT